MLVSRMFNNHLYFFFALSCCDWNSSTLGSGSILSSNGTVCSHPKMIEFNKTIWLVSCTSRTRSHFHGITVWSTVTNIIASFCQVDKLLWLCLMKGLVWNCIPKVLYLTDNSFEVI